MKDKIFGVLQRVGRSFMLPIAILPVAGLLLGVGGSFTNETMLRAYGLWGFMGPGTVFYAVFEVMKEAGAIVFANLPILFAMGVAIGMAKKRKRGGSPGSGHSFFDYACINFRHDYHQWGSTKSAQRRDGIGSGNHFSADGCIRWYSGGAWRGCPE